MYFLTNVLNCMEIMFRLLPQNFWFELLVQPIFSFYTRQLFVWIFNAQMPHILSVAHVHLLVEAPSSE